MRLSVVTPTKKIAEDLETSEITIQGGKGQIQVLSGHTELMSTLEPGILSYQGSDGKRQYLAISFGYIEVQKDQVMVLAHTAETKFDLDLERAKAAQKKAEEALERGVGHDHFRKYELKLFRSHVRQEVAKLD